MFSRYLQIKQTALLGLQPLDKAVMLGVNTTEFFLEEFSLVPRRDMLLFLTTNMAAVMSRGNQPMAYIFSKQSALSLVTSKSQDI